MPVMSPQVFAILSGLVEERTGLHYGLDQRDLFADRVSARATELGHESLLDYYYLLRYDDPGGAELQALAETLVINETFLFRELDQLEAMVSRLIAPAVARGERVRIWSAACSTGEEPVTIAALLAERSLLDRCEIVATDLSGRALDRARRGVFGRRALRAPPASGVVGRWFRVEGDQVAARPELLASIRWQQLNLVDATGVAALGIFDVVLCRNVLIYFRDETARRVVQSLSGRLRPQGALFVGVAESLLRFGTTLECEELGGVFFYRKPA